jgi:hypothetical protein
MVASSGKSFATANGSTALRLQSPQRGNEREAEPADLAEVDGRQWNRDSCR